VPGWRVVGDRCVEGGPPMKDVQATEVRGVLFDFAQTLFYAASDALWLRRAATSIGMRLQDLEIDRFAQRLAAARTRPEVVAQLQGADCSQQAHRAAFMGWLDAAALSPELGEALYRQLQAPAMWTPYPDAPRVLETLRRRRVPTGLVSNTGWNIRTHLAHHGLLRFVDACTLSFEHGAEKPDPLLFRAAYDSIGVDPSQVLMVGDDPISDGGAVRIGMRVYLLPPADSGKAPRGLDAVLRLL
jgi:HAD superfamily hydrolase (TIGR01493 family)